MIQEGSNSKWKFDAEQWDSDRQMWPYVRDLVFESPSGQLAAVIYSIVELRMMWEVGSLSILHGNPIKPDCLFRPANFACMGFDNKSAAWLQNDQYLSVRAFMYDRETNRLEVPFCLLDLTARTYTYYPIMNSCIASIQVENGQWVIRESERDERFERHDGEVIQPDTLRWLPWDQIERRYEHYFSGLFGKAT